MAAPTRTPALPWLPREARLVAAAGGACLILLTVCWYQAAGHGRTSKQLPWLDVATAAVALYWLLSGRVVARARRRVAARRAVQFAALARPTRAGEAVADMSVPSGGLVRAPGMTRAHLPECPLLAGKPIEPAPDDAAGCGICGR
jgi:hypothetical protein